jgi:hypothetical protein
MAKMNQQWKTFACRYYHDGKWWALDLVAQSDDDAQARAKKLGNLQLLGEVKMQIPAWRGAGLFARLLVSSRNAFRGLV